MIILLKFFGFFILYIFVGSIMLLIFKAIFVIKYDDSNLWAYDEDDITLTMFWPILLIIGLPYVIYNIIHFLTKGLYKIFIAIVETARAIHKVKEEDNG